MSEEASKVDLKGVFQKLIPGVIGKQIEKSCQGIFPLQNVFVRKVKITKKPKFDLIKLMEMHSDSKEETGTKVARQEEVLVESMAGSGGRL